MAVPGPPMTVKPGQSGDTERRAGLQTGADELPAIELLLSDPC